MLARPLQLQGASAAAAAADPVRQPSRQAAGSNSRTAWPDATAHAAAADAVRRPPRHAAAGSVWRPGFPAQARPRPPFHYNAAAAAAAAARYLDPSAKHLPEAGEDLPPSELMTLQEAASLHAAPLDAAAHSETCRQDSIPSSDAERLQEEGQRLPPPEPLLAAAEAASLHDAPLREKSAGASCSYDAEPLADGTGGAAAADGAPAGSRMPPAAGLPAGGLAADTSRSSEQVDGQQPHVHEHTPCVPAGRQQLVPSLAARVAAAYAGGIRSETAGCSGVSCEAAPAAAAGCDGSIHDDSGSSPPHESASLSSAPEAASPVHTYEGRMRSVSPEQAAAAASEPQQQRFASAFRRQRETVTAGRHWLQVAAEWGAAIAVGRSAAADDTAASGGACGCCALAALARGDVAAATGSGGAADARRAHDVPVTMRRSTASYAGQIKKSICDSAS